MTRMVGTGKAPQGYLENQVFDVADSDHGTVDDLERKGWAKLLDPADDPGRTKVQIANSIVRGDALLHPDDADVAEEIGGHDEALAIVHLEDETATPKDYEADADEGRKRDALGQPYSSGQIKVLERDAHRAQQGARGASGTKRKKSSEDK